MITLETTLVITLTLVLLCGAILFVPQVYETCRTASRLEVLNSCGDLKGQALYQIDPIVGWNQTVPGLQTSARQMLLYGHLIGDLANGLFRWFGQ